MGKTLYALEKLAEAVDALATGAGRVQERLSQAAICLLSVRPDEIPEGLRRVLMGVKDDLVFEPARGGEGRIAATMRVTGDEDAREIARRILFPGLTASADWFYWPTPDRAESLLIVTSQPRPGSSSGTP
jgi:hypothetical protein